MTAKCNFPSLIRESINWDQRLNASEILKICLELFTRQSQLSKKNMAENVEHFDDYFTIIMEFKHAKN